jgi:hypothetical protein
MVPGVWAYASVAILNVVWTKITVIASAAKQSMRQKQERIASPRSQRRGQLGLDMNPRSRDALRPGYARNLS